MDNVQIISPDGARLEVSSKAFALIYQKEGYKLAADPSASQQSEKPSRKAAKEKAVKG